MARHFKIAIRVLYDEAHPIPDNIIAQLGANVMLCVERDRLLNDRDLEAVIEDYDYNVEEVTST